MCKNSDMSSIVTEVLANAGRIEKIDLDAKLGALSKKMMELKLEVYESLEKKYKAFAPNLMMSVDLMTQVKQLSNEMEAVATKVEKETQLRLTMSAKEFQSLSAQLSETNAVLQVLTRLVGMDEALKEFGESLAARKYQRAVGNLTRVHDLLAAKSSPRDSEIKILQALNKKYSFEKERLISDVTKAWLDMVHWELHDAMEKKGFGPMVRVSLCIKCTETQTEEVYELVQAMQDLGILQQKIKNFGDRFLKSVVELILNDENLATTIERQDTGETLLLSPMKVAKPESSSPVSCLNHICEAVLFLQKLFSTEVTVSTNDRGQVGNVKSTLMSILSSFIDKQLVEAVITKRLADSIPSSSKDLEAYSEVITGTENFQNQLKRCGFLHDDDNTLADFVNNVNILFANKKCQELLEHARRLMTGEMHNMVSIGPIGADDLPPVGLEGTSAKHSKLEGVTFISERQLNSKTFHLPVCCISESVKKLMDLAYETLHEAVCAQNSAQCSIQLFYSTRNMFVLFCEVVPTYHRQSLNELPQLTAIHHNDCMYIAHHLLTLGHQFRRGLPPPLNRGAATFVDLVPRLRRQGTEVFVGQVIRQRDLVLECLNTAEGFANVSEEGNHSKATKAIRQMLHQIQRLCNLWRGVLPLNIYCSSIGALLNTAVVDIISKVTSLEDISADDASELHSLMSLVTDKAVTFFEIRTNDGRQRDAKQMLHANVKKWNKFVQVMWVLNVGLHDIGDRWANGKGPLAAELEASELKQLIRALFQNTEKRSTILASIK